MNEIIKRNVEQLLDEKALKVFTENSDKSRRAKIMSEDEEHLWRKYGPPFFPSNSGIKSLNQRYFAGLFMQMHLIFYASEEERFYLYDQKNGTWETANDEFIQEKIADMVHAFPSRYEITAAEILEKNTVAFQANVIRTLKGMSWNSNAFSARPQAIHCANKMLIYDHMAAQWQSLDFAPEYFSRNRSPIRFEPKTECPEFLDKLLRPAMTQDDIEILQLYVGQCLLGDNSSQTFLLLTGTAGGGKSTLVNIIEGIVGDWNCTELRLEHMTGRFELSRTNGKTLLTAKDVDSEFLSSAGAKKLKALTGKDKMTDERKNSNKAADVVGNFNVIITSNSLLQPSFDGDVEAWRRRLLWISYENPPTVNRVTHFDELLLEKEGSGILNWALTGAAKLLQHEGQIIQSPEQNARIDFLLKSADPVTVFVKNFIRQDVDSTVSTSEAVSFIKRFCDKMGWPMLTDRRIQVELKDAMLSVYKVNLRTDVKRNGKHVRGYYNVRFAAPDQVR